MYNQQIKGLNLMASLDKRSNNGRMTNYMEQVTEGVLEELLSEYKGARFTENAIRDIKALALNRLWPMYTTTAAGRQFLKRIVVEDKVEKDVVRELRAAIDIVRSHPR